MTEETRIKISQIYDAVTDRVQKIIQVFEDQFTEEMVDNNLISFDDFLNYLNGFTLGDMGITRWADSNASGSYVINQEDYSVNGKGKPFLEYTPEGIIDYLRPEIETTLKTQIRENIRKEEKYTRDNQWGDTDVLITIRFPEVTVTNEHDRSVVIQDLYVRVPISFNGCTLAPFRMTRATFSFQQWLSGYSHSHLPSIRPDSLSGFQMPCLGRGPVNRTIATLKNNYDINIWGLYAFEIAKYVTVESLAGVPYRRLEDIGKTNDTVLSINTPLCEPPNIQSVLWSIDSKDFVQYFFSLKTMKIAYKDGIYQLGESYLDYWIKVSNAFITWYNRKIMAGECLYGKKEDIMEEYIISEGKIYSSRLTKRIREMEACEGKELFIFKGKIIKLHILDDAESRVINTTHLINMSWCNSILATALKIINYNYGRTDYTKRNQTKGEVQTCPRTFYL